MGGDRSKSAYYCELGERPHTELKGVISDYLARLEAHSGDTQAIGE